MLCSKSRWMLERLSARIFLSLLVSPSLPKMELCARVIVGWSFYGIKNVFIEGEHNSTSMKIACSLNRSLFGHESG